MEGELKIYFIYSQKGEKSNIIKIELNEQIKKIEKISEGRTSKYLYILYCITISNNKDGKNIILELIDQNGIYYTSKIKNLDKFQFKIIFESEDEAEYSLNQVFLSQNEQYDIFRNSLKNENNFLFDLFSSLLNSIKLDKKTIFDFNFMLFLFLEIYKEYKNTSREDLKCLIKKYFESFDMKILNNSKIEKHLDIKEKDLDLLLKYDNIRNELISMTNNSDEINEKIDVFLCYYYLHYKPKIFIYYINNKKESKEINLHLTKNRIYFNNFSLDILNFGIMDEAETLGQVVSLMSLLPSLVDCFRIMSNYVFFLKVSSLTQIENKVLDLIKIKKPQKDDNIDSLYDYFYSYHKNCIQEYYFPALMKSDIFFDYCKMYLNKDLNKIKKIIEILKKYNENIVESSKLKIEPELNKYYFDTVIYLINNHKLINNDLINFIANEPEFFNYVKDKKFIQNGIIIDGKDESFINNLLNNNLGNIDFKYFLGNDYYQFIENLFNKFVYPRDLLSIMKWDISYDISQEVIDIFLKAIERIWLNDKKNHMYGLEKLLAKGFGIASIKLNDYMIYINELENNISNDRLLPIYSELLLRNYKLLPEFKEHIIEYINNSNIRGPLAIWYLLTTIDDQIIKFNFLEKNLTEELAVKPEDFIHYKAVIEDRIMLFCNLYNGNYFNDHIKRLTYYTKSIKVTENFENLKFKDAMIMYKNIIDIQQLLFFFTIANTNYEKEFMINTFLIDFSEKCDLAKKHYESLKTILDYFNRFFPEEKNIERKKLKQLINEYENSPLKEYYNFYNKTEYFLDFLFEANNAKKLSQSIFFKEIYEQSKTIYNNNNQERSRYNYSFNNFKELKLLGNNSNLNLLQNDLINIIVKAVHKNIDRLDEELLFIQSYFNFNSADNIENKNFDSKMLKINILKLVNKYQDENGEHIYNYDDSDDDDDDINDNNENNNENNDINNGNNDENNNDNNGDDDDDDEFSLFGKEDKVEKDKVDKKNEVIKKDEIIKKEEEDKKDELILNQKMKIINEINSLSNNFFSTAKTFIKTDEKNNLYKKYIDLFLRIFEINYGFAKLRNKEFFDEVIYLIIKIYMNGISLGLMDDIQNNNKKELILISEFFDISKAFLQRHKSKGIFFKLMNAYNNLYKVKDSKDLQILENLDNVFTLINDNIPYKNGINLLIELLIKENKKLEKSKDFIDFILKHKILYKDLAPIINDILKEDLAHKLRFEDGEIEFNNELLNKMNETCKDEIDFEEMILFYFETKIINILNEKYNKEKGNEKEIINEYKYLNTCFGLLENEFNTNPKIKDNIKIMYCIAFIKCFLNKLINYIYTEYQNVNNLESIFISIIKGSSIKNKLRTSFKLYVLKLLFNKAGNYYDYSKLEKASHYQIDYINDEDIKELINNKQESNIKSSFGFDYLLMPFKEQTNFNFIMNELIKIVINDENNNEGEKSLMEIIKNNYGNLDIDTFFCAISNVHFSFYYKNNYNNCEESEKINNFLINLINEKECNILNYNEMIKKIFLILIKKLQSNENEIYSYNQLVGLLFSVKYVLFTLSSNNNGLFNQLFANINNIISNFKKFFSYYFKDRNLQRDDAYYLTYKLIKYIILSHLYFGHSIGVIKMSDINSLLFLEENDENNNINYILKLLLNEFDIIRNLLNLIGINKTIIFMNSVFYDISKIIIEIKCDNDDEYIKGQELLIDSEINKRFFNFSFYVDEYYKNLSKIQKENNEDNIYFNILYETNKVFENNKYITQNFPFITYLTNTNFCTFDDFEKQFLYFSIEKYPLINSIIKNDDIIEIIECLPKINDFINFVYNELSLKISKDCINEKINKIFTFKNQNQNIKDRIKSFNEAYKRILKIFKEDNIKEINEESQICEIINIKDNNINKIYAKIIERYNKFLKDLKIFNKNIIKPVIIQNSSELDYIRFNKNIYNKNISIKDRLNEMIQLYSKRNRINNNKVNIYNGGAIIYDFDLIENKLEEEYILGKKTFEENQRLFIFSNEVFSEKRNNILIELNNKYPQEEIKEEYMKKIEEFLIENSNDLLKIYYDLQYLLIHLLEKKEKIEPDNIRISDIIKIILKENYKMSDEFNKFLKSYDDIITINNILFFYEKIELKLFDKLTEKIKPKKEIKKEIRDKIDKYFEKNNLLLNKDILSDSLKKYILRYCLGNYDIQNEALNNLTNFNDIFNRSDIFREKIFKDERYQEEFNQLNRLNDNKENNIINYFYNLIYNDKEDDKPNEGEEVEEEEIIDENENINNGKNIKPKQI